MPFWKKLCPWLGDKQPSTPEVSEETKDPQVDLVESQSADYDAVAFSKIRATESMRSWKKRYFVYAGLGLIMIIFRHIPKLRNIRLQPTLHARLPKHRNQHHRRGLQTPNRQTLRCPRTCRSLPLHRLLLRHLIHPLRRVPGLQHLRRRRHPLLRRTVGHNRPQRSPNIRPILNALARLRLQHPLPPLPRHTMGLRIHNRQRRQRDRLALGIGMFAILMPFCASLIIITLAVFQFRAKQSGLILRQRLTPYDFCSHIDLGGTLLLSGGFALLLILITVASTTTSRWKTPWVDALIALGILSLVALYPYERYIAKHPVVPVRYFRVLAIVSSVCLTCIDNVGFGVTHTYLYAWATISRGFSARNAQFLTYTNGVMQALTGMVIGLIIYRLRSYKWILVAGAIIRLIGYGVMIRLRTNDSSIAELFIVQLVQGLGSGTIETIVIVASQIVVPHRELAQVTSLLMLSAFLGNGIGSAIAGGIYTDMLKSRLRVRLGEGVSEGNLDKLYNSITGALPAWGSSERIAVNRAYSDVMGYMTIAALGIAVPVVILALFVPNNRLGDGHNLVQYWSTNTATPSEENEEEKETR